MNRLSLFELLGALLLSAILVYGVLPDLPVGIQNIILTEPLVTIVTYWIVFGPVAIWAWFRNPSVGVCVYFFVAFTDLLSYLVDHDTDYLYFTVSAIVLALVLMIRLTQTQRMALQEQQ